MVEECATPAFGPGLAAHAEETFLDLLRQFERQGRAVSATPSANYAPKLFAEHPHSRGVNKRAFSTAMDSLLGTNRIVVEETGSPSRRRSKLVISAAPERVEDE